MCVARCLRRTGRSLSDARRKRGVFYMEFLNSDLFVLKGVEDSDKSEVLRQLFDASSRIRAFANLNELARVSDDPASYRRFSGWTRCLLRVPKWS